MGAYSDVVEERTKASSRRALAAVIMVIGATIVPVVGLASWGVPSGEPALLMLYVSTLNPVSADGEYSSMRVAVDNAGSTMAEACTVKAYNRLPYSYEADEASVLGKSEQFDLSPEGGHLTTVSLHLPTISGEALSGGGVRAPVSLRTECENAESLDYGRILNLPSTVTGSEAPSSNP